jgi:hypothetical protein
MASQDWLVYGIVGFLAAAILLAFLWQLVFWWRRRRARAVLSAARGSLSAALAGNSAAAAFALGEAMAEARAIAERHPGRLGRYLLGAAETARAGGLEEAAAAIENVLKRRR